MADSILIIFLMFQIICVFLQKSNKSSHNDYSQYYGEKDNNGNPI